MLESYLHILMDVLSKLLVDYIHPLYSTEKELKQLGIKNTNRYAKRKRSHRKRDCSHILTMQKTEGGFALWAQGGREEFWLTAYATDFLI